MTSGRPPPPHFRPMLAVAGELPEDSGGWAYELKWDGTRAITSVYDGEVRIVSRGDHDVTVAYPELRPLGLALAGRTVVLDGEIVALNRSGRPSFSALQPRMQVHDARRAAQLAAQVPVVLVLFDLLYQDHESLLPLAYEQRRQQLESLGLSGQWWATPKAYHGPGTDVLAMAADRGLEGVMAKRLDSPYLPGRRSPDWRKVKCVAIQEVVIGGWSTGSGRRQETLGALLVGLPAREGLAGKGGLVYAGKVGSGFSDAALSGLSTRLAAMARESSPFGDSVPKAEAVGAHWVEPALVGEVRFTEWTPDGRLRHPTWRGLRTDRSPEEVRREG